MLPLLNCSTSNDPVIDLQKDPGEDSLSVSLSDLGKESPAESIRDPLFAFKEQASIIGLTKNQSEFYKDLQSIEAMAGGAASGDFDNDGDPDLFLSRNRKSGLLYENQGNGVYKEITEGSGLESSIHSNGALWVDIDNDGDLDLVLSTLDSHYYLYINKDPGQFEEESLERGLIPLEEGLDGGGFSISAGDYNKDGWLDLHINHWEVKFKDGQRKIGRLFKNTGQGHFKEVTLEAGLIYPEGIRIFGQSEHDTQYAFASTFVDLDNDGWQDLAIASDFGTSQLFWNNKDGTFSNGTKMAQIGSEENAMGTAFSDIDGDGYLDWFITSIYDPNCMVTPCGAWGGTGNRLFRNNGDRTFSDWTDKFDVRDGGWGWGANFFDYDHDSFQELVMTNGFGMADGETKAFAKDPLKLWQLKLDSPMEISQESGLRDQGAGKGLLTIDHDRDGDLDILIINNQARPVFYVNTIGQKNNWLQVEVKTKEGRDALGAVVQLKLDQPDQTYTAHLGTGHLFLAQSQTMAHFGLGKGNRTIQSLRVFFPQTGQEKILQDVTANQVLKIQLD